MGATLRYDLLDNRLNGGGGSSIVLDGTTGQDGTNGFGLSKTCLAASANNGAACRGAARQAITADLLFYPTTNTILKFEYRHDMSSHATFVRSDGGYSRSNDILGTQLVYSY
ncbi:hypothetical protein A6V36_36095 [Paraburkholderia ginsengiterrae]|uniref:Porin domain-containing protein n=2 Tax=Paraburkholderia ginsengiterrae TaxID=1462993 RepID=A0A1A9MZH0_9BURK|nr:hypothetical protein A6V37_35420 [Paraburkholderia ginsengiterrae]OAJ54324.1 hypothetical protein A6V36_36095 [Paraburkholderia ginsengiterrae]